MSKKSRPRELLVWTAWILALAAAYLSVGRLSLELAVPPGYASPFFPSAGVALAAVLLRGKRIAPGIFLGSVGVTLLKSEEAGAPLDTTAALLAIGIGLGAALQAVLAAGLVRRFVGWPSPLDRDRSILLFLGLGGPLGCVISSTVGVTTLVLTGAIPAGGFLFHWGNWWIGDTLGVLIATPAILTLFALPSEIWRRRRRSVALPLLLASLALVALFARTRAWEHGRLQSEFKTSSEPVAFALMSRVTGFAEVLYAVERFYASSEVVNRDEFESFTRRYFERLPWVQTLEWIPRVSALDRQRFESLAGAERFPGFEFTECDETGEMVRAGEREEYYPVYFLQPYKGNERALGFDLASDPSRRETLEFARDGNRLAVTPPLKLVQAEDGELQYLFVLPVFRKDSLLSTRDQRVHGLLGFVAGVLRLGEALRAGLPAVDDPASGGGIGAARGAGSEIEEYLPPSFDGRDLTLRLYDETDGPSDEPIFSTVDIPADTRPGVEWSVPFELAQRDLRMRFLPTEHFLAAHQTWQVWLVMVTGLMFTSLLGAFLLVVTGRTAQVERLVDRRTDELREANLLMRAIVDHSIEAIISVDEQARIASFNPAAERLFDFRASDVLGRCVKILMPPPFCDATDDSIVTLLDQTRSQVVGIRKEVLGKRRDGTTIPIEIAVSEVDLPDKHLYTAILHDLSERKKVERLKNDFISTVSHELRTPLTSIHGSLGLLAGEVPEKLSPPVKKLIDVAWDNSTRLSQLIDDLLDFEKLELGGLDFSLEVQPLLPILEEAVATTGGFAARYGVGLSMDAPEAVGCLVNVDRKRLIQVIDNLLSNAIKFSPRGGEVEVRTRRQDGWARVSVSDHGPGIPVEFRERIFDKFAQADSSDSRKSTGTGLGLSIAKGMIERMGGRIDFRSAPDRGTTFFFELPVRD